MDALGVYYSQDKPPFGSGAEDTEVLVVQFSVPPSVKGIPKGATQG